MQLLTPDNMRGRVNAVNSLFIGASNQLGEFRVGHHGRRSSDRSRPVVVGGIGTLIIVAAWARLFPALRKVQTLSG